MARHPCIASWTMESTRETNSTCGPDCMEIMHKIAAALQGVAVGGAADDADDAAEMRGASDGNRWSMRLLGTFVDSSGHKNYRVMTQDAVSSAMHVRVYKDVELSSRIVEVFEADVTCGQRLDAGSGEDRDSIDPPDIGEEERKKRSRSPEKGACSRRMVVPRGPAGCTSPT